MELGSAHLCERKPSQKKYLKECNAERTDQPRLLVWSAFDETALKDMVTRFREYMLENIQGPEQVGFLDELALTLSKKRSFLPCRTYVVARSRDELGAQLETNLTMPTRIVSAPKLGFVFTGQGAQWPMMGRDLLMFPVYKQSLHLAGLHLRRLGCQWDIIDEMSSSQSTSNLNEPVYSQPICTVLQVALVDLLTSWGVFPRTVIGHSSGEIAAAYCSGAISRESAWGLAYHRGTVAAVSKKRSSAPLAMMAVGLSVTNFQSYWESTQSVGGYVAVACFNSPQSITISGCEKRIDAIKQVLDDNGVLATKLKVDVAYHSSYMENVSALYRELIKNIDTSESGSVNVTMFSSVTGMRVSSKQLQQSSYWVDNMVSPVQFTQAVENAFVNGPSQQGNDAVDHLLEIGPHSTLQGPLKQILRAPKDTKSVGYSSILVRSKPALETILEAMGQVFCKGFPVDIERVNRSSLSFGGQIQLADLPSYPWNHAKKYWLEGRISRNHRFRKFSRHGLLGTPVSDWNPLEARWRHTVRLSENSWIGDHKVLRVPCPISQVRELC